MNITFYKAVLEKLNAPTTDENLKFIYTGLQIINPEVFSNVDEKVFSINKVWNQLIKSNQLFGLESKVDFLHISTLNIYKKLNIK